VVLDNHYIFLYLLMMASLKAFLPTLAPILATTPDALYSRQRALINLGLLATRKGRGPGSGVELSADSLAVLLIACLCSETLAETDQRVVAICGATDWDSRTTYREAVAATLSEQHGQIGQTRALAVDSQKAIRVFQRLDGLNEEVVYRVAKDRRFNDEPSRPIERVLEIRLATLERIRAALRNSLSEGTTQ
jgi:hypothetical protein